MAEMDFSPPKTPKLIKKLDWKIDKKFDHRNKMTWLKPSLTCQLRFFEEKLMSFYIHVYIWFFITEISTSFDDVWVQLLFTYRIACQKNRNITSCTRMTCKSVIYMYAAPPIIMSHFYVLLVLIYTFKRSLSSQLWKKWIKNKLYVVFCDYIFQNFLVVQKDH